MTNALPIFKTFRKILTILFCIILIWFFFHVVYIFYIASIHPTRHAHAALVLGAKVHENGALSSQLECRVAAALELYQKDMVDYIVVSGGLGKEGHYEADKMRDYLTQYGVPDEKIIVDNQGINTYLTVMNYLDIQKQYQFDSVIVVSQYFHLPRAAELLKRMGIQDVQSYSPNYYEWLDIFSIPREFIAFYFYWLKYPSQNT